MASLHPVSNKRLCRISLKFGVKYYSAKVREANRLKRLGLFGKKHKGIDITPKWGYKSKTYYLVAPVSGRVKTSGYHRGWGYHCKIDSGESDKPACHILAHMEKVFVKPGQYVKKGQKIGIMGNSGFSTAKHLHFEVRKPNASGKWVSVNPASYLT